MFGCGNQDALPHQAGGVADLLNMTPTGGYLETVQIGADKNDTGRGRCGKDTDADWNARMKADARCFDRPLDRRLESQKSCSKLGIDTY